MIGAEKVASKIFFFKEDSYLVEVTLSENVHELNVMLAKIMFTLLLILYIL